MVFGIAWRILGHAADAEDVVQDVFLEVHRMCQERRNVRRWQGLLQRLAVCRALDRLRQRKPVAVLDERTLVAATASPEEFAIGRELAERMRSAVAELPPREAQVFCLRYFEELDNQQIAETLRIPAGAVSTALHKARTKLETLLAGVIQGE